MFLKCFFIRRKLVDYYDNSLSHEQKSKLESHLSVCASCSGSAYRYRKTRELVNEIEDHHRPPDEYWNTVWDRIRQKLFNKG